jgi:hypothetical protein
MGFDIAYVLSVAYSLTAGRHGRFAGASLSDMFGRVKAAQPPFFPQTQSYACQEIKHAVIA